MKLTKIILSSLIFFTCLSFTYTPESEWELRKDKNGVKVWTRDVEYSNFKEFKAEVVVEGTLGSLVKIVDDASNYEKWLYNCSEARKLKKVSEDEGYTYTVTDAPWPVSDRDVVTHWKISQDPKTKVVTIDLDDAPDMMPGTDYVRISDMKGYWKFTPISKGKTKMAYQLYTDPSGSIPSSIANAFVVDLPYESLLNVKEMLKKNTTLSNHHYPGIQEVQ